MMNRVQGLAKPTGSELTNQNSFNHFNVNPSRGNIAVYVPINKPHKKKTSEENTTLNTNSFPL